MKLEVTVIYEAHGVNLRAQPTTASDIVGWKAFNSVVIAVEQQGTWYKLSDGNWMTSLPQYVKVTKDLEFKPVIPMAADDPRRLVPDADPNVVDSNPALAALVASLQSPSDGMKFDGTGASKTPITSESSATTVPDTSAGTFSEYSGVVPWDDSFVQANMDIVRGNLNITPTDYADVKKELYVNFNRFKVAYPELYLGKSFSQVFFTRPDINILKGGDVSLALPTGQVSEAQLNSQFIIDPTFYALFNQERRILMSLTKHITTSHDFNVYLSNAAESFEISDEFIETIEHGETMTGYKMQYGKNNVKSNTAGNFSVAYTDDRDANIYKMHKAWVEYISKVFRGEASPKREYIIRRVLDYACSVYYFILGPDGETILFWSKYFGVFPTNTPASAYSWSKGANLRMPQFNISYAYAFKEDFNPLSLAEFNMNSSSTDALNYANTYEPELAATGRTFVGAPFIETIIDSVGQYVFKLRFRKDGYEGRHDKK